MKHRRLFATYLIISLIVIPLTFLLVKTVYDSSSEDKKECNTKVNIRPSAPVLNSIETTDFVDEELADYDIVGKWHVVGDDGYVIARKDGQLWSTYYNKEEKSVGVLVELKERIEDGDTIIYSEQTYSGEYMMIRPKGLYLYGKNGLEPVVWPVEK